MLKQIAIRERYTEGKIVDETVENHILDLANLVLRRKKRVG
jgi:hypothetical protein